MSNEFNVAVKLQADASQYTAEFARAGRTAQPGSWLWRQLRKRQSPR